MTPEQWLEVKQLFEQTRPLPAPDRAAFLDGAAPDDAEVRAEVSRLLEAAEQTDDFLEQPALAAGAQVILDSTQPRLGSRVGPYRLVRLIGNGGMGEVFEAQRDDGEFSQRVAIKLVHRGIDSRNLLSLFRRERQILANLSHPNIARLLDGGATPDGMPYFAMEYIEGQPIDQYCAARHLPEADRLALIRTVCDAVEYAHRQRVIHRDLKPDNILVTAEGVPKLMDFGIAKLLEPDGSARNSMVSGFRIATPAYASPEHLAGQDLTAATDIYSLGVIVADLIPQLAQGRLRHVIQKATAPEASERYQSAAEFAADLDPAHPFRRILRSFVARSRS